MDLEVVRTELATVRLHDRAPSALGEGEARIRIDRFALTANNITYAVFGDGMGYWTFFPAGPSDDPTVDGTPWGRIPVWGFGDVVETRSADVALGERLYGYFPMGAELVVQCGRADERGITDVSPHRAALASAYNRYQRCVADPAYRADREQHQMLLYPLFFTSFVIDDLLADQADFGAEQIVVSSASAKTSIGVAFLAHQRGRRVVGLTSAGNRGFVESLGVYDQTIVYGAESADLADVPSVYVDVAGDTAVRRAVHTRLGDRLAHSMTVGGTHWTAPVSDDGPLPGPTPAFFFAPAQISKRSKEWGREGLDARVAEQWDRFAGWTDGWLTYQRSSGAEAVTATYLELLGGRVDPAAGHICSLTDEHAHEEAS